MASGSVDIQQLILQFDASTELARRELAKFGSQFDGFTNKTEASMGAIERSFARVSGAAGLLTKSLGGLAAGVGIAGVVNLGRAVLQFADDLDASANQAGIATERYQTLKEALRTLEVDGDKADKAFKALNDTLGAVQGGTAAKGVEDALDRMGVKSKILSGEIQTTDELFDAIAGSAKNFKTEAEFTAAVVDIVGRKVGVDLANALKVGVAGIGELEDAFRDAGGVITDEYIEKLADANEAIDLFAARSKAKLTIWAAESIGFFDRVGQKMFGASASDIADAAAPPSKRVQARDKKRAQATIDALPAGSAIRQLQQDEFDAQYGAEDIVVTGTRAPKAKAKSGGASKAAAKAGKPQLSPAEIRLNGVSDGVADIDGIISGMLDKPLIDLAKYTAGFTALQPILVDLSSVEIIDEDALAAASALTADIADGLAQSIIHGNNLGDALGNAFEAAGAKLLASGILDLLNGLGGTAGSGGILGGIISSVSTAFGGFRAAGGPVTGGKAYVVGEHRPELFIPTGNGHIQSSVGGGGMLVNVDARGSADPAAVRAQVIMGIAEAAPALIAAAQGQTISRIRRPMLSGGRG